MNKKYGIIIQCRDQSTRYERKSVRRFVEDKSILQIIIDKFEHLRWKYKLIVATTQNSVETIGICNFNKVDYFIGPEDRVAERLFKAAMKYKLYGFFRICADNPFVSLPLMYPLIAWIEGDYDYIAFDNCMQRHEGFFMEYIKTKALYRVLMESEGAYSIEHVTPYIINHPNLFKQKILPIPKTMWEYPTRLTVDTESDFHIAQIVYSNMGEMYWENILRYVRLIPSIMEKMIENIEDNKK